MVSTQQSKNMISKADYPLIPEEAFLYFPQQAEIKIGEGKTGLRRIFEGQVTFDEFEKQQLNEFQQYLVKKEANLIPWWDDAKKLRFLYANQFKFDKAMKTMETHQEWRKQSLPPKQSNEVNEFLKKGAFYVHGRDHRFRPVLVINVKRFDFKNIKIEIILDSMTYFFEFILNSMMLPGQIENWVVILDLGNIGLSSLPISGLKQIMGMFATYVVNTPSSIFIPYKIVKGFLEEQTIKKISFYNNGNPKPLFTHCHPSQIENTYGGDIQPQTDSLWPPKVISNQYQMIEDASLSLFQSKDEYFKSYKSGRLSKNITLKEHIEDSDDQNSVNPESVRIIRLSKYQKDIDSANSYNDTYTPKVQQNFDYKINYEPQRSLQQLPNDVHTTKNNVSSSHFNKQAMNSNVNSNLPQSKVQKAFGQEFKSNHQLDEVENQKTEKLQLSQQHSQRGKSVDAYSIISEDNKTRSSQPSVNLIIATNNYLNQKSSNQYSYQQQNRKSLYHSNYTKILQSIFVQA